MTPLPIANWHASLAEMESALGAALNALDRYQSGWEVLLAEQAASPTPGTIPLELRLREWDARLEAAADLAESVERELSDRESAVGRWHESLTEWRNGIEKP